MKDYQFTINGNPYKVTIEKIEDNIATVAVNGTEYKVEMDKEMGRPKPMKPVQVSPATYQATPQAAPQKVETPAPASTGESPLNSPLPGTILELRVREGDTVKEGQTVIVLEAMKMENNVDAHKSGVIKKIHKNSGDAVMEGDVLLTIE